MRALDELEKLPRLQLALVLFWLALTFPCIVLGWLLAALGLPAKYAMAFYKPWELAFKDPAREAEIAKLRLAAELEENP